MIARKTSVVVSVTIALLVALVPLGTQARELRRRALTIDDASLGSLPVIHVAPGMATVIAFQADIRDATFVRPVGALFQKLTRTDRTVVVVPKQVVKQPVTLNVVMADGTVLTFALATGPKDVDVQVDVTIALRSAPDSPEALKAQVATLRAQIDECRGTSEKAGASNIAALILARGIDAPQAFETHSLRAIERQNRLLVQARRVYRLLGFTYVVLSVDNRDPQRNWVLARPVVRLTGGGPDVELAVVAFPTDQQELLPDNEERVVVAFKTPDGIGSKHRISITLLEKDGMRPAELKDLEL
jgi:uncharacterized protein (TIGR02268 family)